ncbi:MAG: hypothetical protein V4736_13335, partial [Bdellovibrionota bacterium]
KMGIQVNPSFGTEGADGVVITKNIANEAGLSGKGVYIEVQRGDLHSVANPQPGVKPMKVLVLLNAAEPLKVEQYVVHTLQNSNISDDNETVLPQDNPVPVMTNEQIKDLAFQVTKAQLHFKPIMGANDDDFALDLEFKVDAQDTGSSQVYIKQARPYID